MLCPLRLLFSSYSLFPAETESEYVRGILRLNLELSILSPKVTYLLETTMNLKHSYISLPSPLAPRP